MFRRRLKSSVILQQSWCTVGHGIVRELPNAYTWGVFRLYFVFSHFNIKSEGKRMEPSLTRNLPASWGSANVHTLSLSLSLSLSQVYFIWNMNSVLVTGASTRVSSGTIAPDFRFVSRFSCNNFLTTTNPLIHTKTEHPLSYFSRLWNVCTEKFDPPSGWTLVRESRNRKMIIKKNNQTRTKLFYTIIFLTHSCHWALAIHF